MSKAEATKEVIKLLNKALRNELTAINQYFLHARMLRFMGFSKLADKAYEESIDEMKHADSLMQRIFQLGGLPNLQDMGKLYIGETPEETLKCDLKLEHEAIPFLKDAIKVCEDALDYTSAELLTQILMAEEGHVEWLNTQMNLIEKLGVTAYLQTQV